MVEMMSDNSKCNEPNWAQKIIAYILIGFVIGLVLAYLGIDLGELLSEIFMN